MGGKRIYDYGSNALRLARAIKPNGSGLSQHDFYEWGISHYYNLGVMTTSSFASQTATIKKALLILP